MRAGWAPPLSTARDLADSESMRTLVGYLRSSLTGISGGERDRSLRAYLQRFPGGLDALMDERDRDEHQRGP